MKETLTGLCAERGITMEADLHKVNILINRMKRAAGEMNGLGVDFKWTYEVSVKSQFCSPANEEKPNDTNDIKGKREGAKGKPGKEGK